MVVEGGGGGGVEQMGVKGGGGGHVSECEFGGGGNFSGDSGDGVPRTCSRVCLTEMNARLTQVLISWTSVTTVCWRSPPRPTTSLFRSTCMEMC